MDKLAELETIKTELETKTYLYNIKLAEDNLGKVMDDIEDIFSNFSSTRVINWGDGVFWERNVINVNNHYVIIPIEDIREENWKTAYHNATSEIMKTVKDFSKDIIFAFEGYAVEKGIMISYGWLYKDETDSSH